MAGLDDLFKGNVATGLAIGIGAAILTPVIVPLVASIGKPLAKSMIKTGLLLVEKGRETAAELGEVLEDLVAEAKAELEAVSTAEAGGAVMTASAAAAEEVAPAPPDAGGGPNAP